MSKRGKSSSHGQNGTATIPLSEETGGNVDQIRDILFGGKMRDYEKRFGRLEEHCGQEVVDLRMEMEKRVEVLESFFKEELEALNTRCKAQAEEQMSTLNRLQHSLDQLGSKLEAKQMKLGEKQLANERQFRNQLMQQSKHLTEEIRNKHDHLFSHFEQEGGDIRQAMVDRLVMADLFQEVSLRLKQECEVPQEG